MLQSNGCLHQDLIVVGQLSTWETFVAGEVGAQAIADGADAGPSDTELLLLLGEVRLGGELL